MAPAGLKGGRAKMLTSAKNNMNFVARLYNYNSLQDWVTTHAVEENLFRSTMNLWILVLKLKCLSRTHSESFSYSVCAQGWVKCFSICDYYAKHSPSFFPS